MGKRRLQEIEAYADGILKRYFADNDVEYLISTFADDIIWLGAGEKQRAEGKEAVAQCFRAGKDELAPCDMFNQQYIAKELTQGCYLCEGISWIQARTGTQMILQEQQRITFIFRENAGKLETVHIHHSIAYDALQGDELFPAEAAKEAYQNLKNALLQKDKEFEQQAQFLAQLYNTVPCGIIQFALDAEYSIVNANRMVWKLYGYNSKESFERDIQNLLQILQEKDRQWVVKVLESLKLNGRTRSYTRESIRKNGEKFWINVVMGRIVNTDGAEVLQAVFTDITEMKTMQLAAEREQALENRLLRTAISTAYPLILSVNMTKDIYNCFVEDRECFIEQRQGKYTDLVKNSAPLVYPSYQEDFVANFNRDEVMRRFQSGEHEVYMELQQIGADGEYHWIAVHLILVENPFSDDLMVIDLIKLLDNQRAEAARQEQLLRDALASAKAANRAKSDFLSRMSHDIRTPMNAIIGMSAIGQLKLEEKESVRDCFCKIDVSSRYLLSLLNDILDMSQIETGKMEIAQESFEFPELIGEINQIIYPQTLEQGLNYEIYTYEPLGKNYIGDSLRMKQILMNLLSNAIKFTSSGGMVHMKIREVKRNNGFAYVEFCIRDTGIGMSKEFRRRIFQPFEQESKEGARNNVGSGLGLSIVYNLVHLMGGTIEVESEKGSGTEFTVVIPFGLLTRNLEQEWEDKKKELLRGLHVLIVDDDRTVGIQAANLLNDIGAQTKWVGSGMEAVEAVKQSMQDQQLYDIAMIDWRMPDMNGIETTREIRKITGRDTMIIMISAYDLSGIESEAREAGVDYFIAKPLFRTTIYDVFSQLKNKAPAAVPENSGHMFTGQRVLIAEDNEMNREIARVLLEMHGIRIEEAVDGQKAVKMVEDHPAGYYMAVLMDIRMPVMDGIQATRMIRAMNRKDAGQIPIIAMTANAFEEDKIEAMEAGMSGYLSKPLEIKLVLDELSKYYSADEENGAADSSL